MQGQNRKRTLELSEGFYAEFYRITEDEQVGNRIDTLYWARGSQKYIVACKIEIYNFHQILNDFLMNKLENNVMYEYKIRSSYQNYTFYITNSNSFNIIFKDEERDSPCELNIDKIYVQMIYNNLERLLNQCDITLNSLSFIEFKDNGFSCNRSRIGFKQKSIVQNNLDFKGKEYFNIKNIFNIKSLLNI